MKKSFRWIVGVILACAVLVLCACETDESIATEQTAITTTPSTVEPVLASIMTSISVKTNTQLFMGALNRNKMYISSIQHLPIYKFENTTELESFVQRYVEKIDFSYKNSLSDSPSFADATAKYDDVFFTENTLFAVYIFAPQCDDEYALTSTYIDETNLQIHITTTKQGVLEAIAEHLLLIEVKREAVASCTVFDAVLDATVSEDTTSVPPEIEAEQVQYPDGTKAWRFFTWQERPAEPQSNINALSLDTTAFCGNGENLEYIDNLTLQSNLDGTYTLSFQLFQDALPYIEPLFLLLNSTVTLSYEGERFDALDTANEHTLFLLNGEKAVVTEVRSGAGNGHRDFYFILQTTDPIVFEDLYSFEFVIS